MTPWFLLLPTPKISHLLFLHVNKKEAYFTFHLMSTHWVFWMWKALNFISDVLNASLCCGGLRPASARYWELSNVLWVVSNENSQRTLIWWTELRFHNHSMIGARLDCENIIKKAKGRKKFFKWSDHFRQYWFYILNTTKILWIHFLQNLYNFVQYIYSQNDILTSFLNTFLNPDSYDKVKVTFGRVNNVHL